MFKFFSLFLFIDSFFNLVRLFKGLRLFIWLWDRWSFFKLVKNCILVRDLMLLLFLLKFCILDSFFCDIRFVIFCFFKFCFIVFVRLGFGKIWLIGVGCWIFLVCIFVLEFVLMYRFIINISIVIIVFCN